VVFGAASSLMSGKLGGGEYISAFGTSLGAAIGAGLVMLFQLVAR
jgi:hypothetical protein